MDDRYLLRLLTSFLDDVDRNTIENEKKYENIRAGHVGLFLSDV